jgi:hypothetical protein
MRNSNQSILFVKHELNSINSDHDICDIDEENAIQVAINDHVILSEMELCFTCPLKYDVTSLLFVDCHSDVVPNS